MVGLYMDENVHGAISKELQRRELDVVLAEQDNHGATDDNLVLNRAGELHRLLFTQDIDLLIIARARQLSGQEFAGVIYAQQGRVSIGTCIEDLAIIAELGEREEFAGKVTFLPLSGKAPS